MTMLPGQEGKEHSGKRECETTLGKEKMLLWNHGVSIINNLGKSLRRKHLCVA